MKLFLFITAVLLLAFPAGAYQAGQANRTNFGSGPQLPAQQQFRSFSNYNNRSWGQGVQTRGVQTQTAGREVAEFEAPAASKPAAQPAAKKAASPANEPKPATPAVTTQPSTAPAAAAQAGQMPPEAAAMMQQVQGLMNMMNGGGAPAGQANPAQAGQAAPAMPAGMPDMSALMGGMLPSAQPAAAPAKK